MAKAKRAKRVKKAGTKSRGRAKGKVSKTSITFRLSPAEIKRAQQCLERSGEIRYTFKNIVVTKLPQVLDDGKLID